MVCLEIWAKHQLTCMTKLARSRHLAVQDTSRLPVRLSEHALHRAGKRLVDHKVRAILGVVKEGRARKKSVAMPKQCRLWATRGTRMWSKGGLSVCNVAARKPDLRTVSKSGKMRARKRHHSQAAEGSSRSTVSVNLEHKLEQEALSPVELSWVTRNRVVPLLTTMASVQSVPTIRTETAFRTLYERSWEMAW